MKRCGLSVFAALIFLSGCIHVGESHFPRTKICGRVIHRTTQRGIAGIAVEVLDVRSRFSLFGIPGPLLLGTVVTNNNGDFEMVARGMFRREQISVYFGDASNFDSARNDIRIISVSTANVPAR